MRKLRARLPLAAVSLLGAATACPAQDAPSKGRLEEVIVTATKREESLRDIPVSISAFQGEQLEQQAITNQENLVRLIPGVVLQSAALDTNRIIVRGISPAPKGAANQTTQVMVGDIPFADNYAPRALPDPLPFDLRAVEVLKGPQGTLFGSGSLNGTVRYIYEPAEFTNFSAKYLGEYTRIHQGDGDFTAAGMVNIPFGESVAMRVVGHTRTEPGYKDNLTLGQKDANYREQDAMRVLLGWRPNERWDVRLNYSWEDSNRHGSNISNNREGRYENTNEGVEGFYKYDYEIGELNIRREFDSLGGFDLVSVTGHVKVNSSKEEDTTATIYGDVDPSSPFAGLRQAGEEPANRTKAWTQEVRLVSRQDSDSPWRWVAGVNYSKQNARGLSLLENRSDTAPAPVLGPPLGLVVSFTQPTIRADWDMEITERSVFGDVTRQLFDKKVELSLGGRYYRFKTGGVTTQAGSLISLTSGMLLVVNEGSLVEDGFNPRVSLSWRPTDSIMAYASASRGFRLGGVQFGWSGPPLLPGQPNVQPPKYVKSDWLWNYEVGLRTAWLDDTLHADVSIFTIDWKNAQFTHSDPGAGAFFTDNVGAVEGEGVEAAIQYLFPIDGLSLGLSTAWTDITTNVDFVTTNGTAPSGTQWPGSFEWQHAATLNYSAELDRVSLSAGVTYSYLDGGAVELVAQKPNDIGYQIWDLQLGVKLRDVKWAPEVSLVVRNVTDDKGLVSNLLDPNFTGIPYNYVTYVQPRAYVLRLSGSF